MDLLKQLVKRPIWLLVFFAAVLPWSLLGAWNAFRSTSNRVDEWMPKGFSATRDLQEFVDLFGSDELLMISWEGCIIGDARAELFKEALLAPHLGDQLFRRVTTAAEVIEVLEDEPLNLSREESLERVAGWLTSSSGDAAGLIALVSEKGAADRYAARDHVLRVAGQVLDLSKTKVRMAGPTIEGVAVDEASQSMLWQLNLASFGICFLVLVLSLRSLRAGLVILGMALFCEQLCLAIIWYSGGRMDSILLLAANLTFVLSISIGIHFFNYYRDALEAKQGLNAPLAALQAAFTPTSLSVLTTAIGLGALTISSIRPIEKFGMYSAIALLAAMVFVLAGLPAHFTIWPLSGREAARSSGLLGTWFARLSQGLAKTYKGVLCVATLALFAGISQLPTLRTSVGLTELLSPTNSLLLDYRWIEGSIGPLIPVEIVLKMPAGDARTVVEQYRVVAAIHEQLRQIPDTTIISSVNFSVEPPPRRGGFRQLVRATAFRRALVDNQDRLMDLGYVRIDKDRHDWRLTLRTSALKDQDYGRLLTTIRGRVDQVLAATELTDQVDPLVTGGVPLVYNAQQQVLNDLIGSFAAAFSLVALTLMVVFRSFWVGLLCMLPNVLPTAIVFGWLAWRGQPVEVGTVLTASAALGISVDDSLHFITWFQRASREGASTVAAVATAYRCCGRAMVQTTLACGLGLSVFAWSEFLPIARFASCITALLFLALVADLLVLPALLMSPLSRLFLRQEFSASQANHLSDSSRQDGHDISRKVRNSS